MFSLSAIEVLVLVIKNAPGAIEAFNKIKANMTIGSREQLEAALDAAEATLDKDVARLAAS